MTEVELRSRLERLEARVSQLTAERDIRDVLDRYARAADRCDVALMKSCYHRDAIDDHGFFSGDA
jgi:SnoaL-like domain